MAKDIDSAFLNIVTQNLGIAHKIARVYYDDSAAREDAVQEMMYQLWRSFPSFDHRSKFSTWMYRVCLNTALTHFARAKRTSSIPLSAQHDNIPDVASNDEEMATLMEAISSLSKLNRAIVLLYMEGLSYEEIATITGLTHGNVSVRLVRIRKELEAFVKRQQG
jgi:RNA polymerase sigma-70 factor (ECF subfamily)